MRLRDKKIFYYQHCHIISKSTYIPTALLEKFKIKIIILWGKMYILYSLIIILQVDTANHPMLNADVAEDTRLHRTVTLNHMAVQYGYQSLLTRPELSWKFVYE